MSMLHYMLVGTDMPSLSFGMAVCLRVSFILLALGSDVVQGSSLRHLCWVHALGMTHDHIECLKMQALVVQNQ